MQEVKVNKFGFVRFKVLYMYTNIKFRIPK